jgi:hypothetical protein
VTANAYDLALLHLRQHRFPVSIWEMLGDVEFLVREMVELEHDRIGLPAVAAGAAREIVE